MGSLPNARGWKVDSVAIVGAGPSGLAAAKYLLAENAFSNIAIFEQRSNVGGLWNYAAGQNHDIKDSGIPKTSPHSEPDEPTWHTNGGAKLSGAKSHAAPVFPSPVYDRLETNIPRGLMGFSDLDWPNDCQLFPQHEQVLEYIERYAEEVKHLIRFQEQVLDVRPIGDNQWRVKTQSLAPGRTLPVETHTFGAILIANGHFNVSSIPSVPGIEDWNKAYPGSILHSSLYRNPDHYADKTVVVVGNSASGVDIAQQIAGVCKLPLLQSQRSESYLAPASSPAIEARPEIVEFVPADRTIRFSNGTEATGVDSIVYCTGYFYSYPFLRTLQPPVVTTGERVENTYQHVFYRPAPTLAFIALNQKVIPFPLAEAQSAVVARVWSGRLDLPDEAEMRAWEQKTLQENGGGRNFHVLKFPKDADYINAMHAWAQSAGKEALTRHRAGEINGGIDGKQNRNALIGKPPPHWGEKEYWTRERFPAIKAAFQGFGDGRHSKHTLEDVGFDFEAWKRGKAEEGRRLL